MIDKLLQNIRRWLPKPLKRSLRLAATFPGYWLGLRQNYAYDRGRFGKYSSADTTLNRKVQLQSWINGDYHKIEKALALKSPRPGFGVAVASRLVENLETYLDQYGIDDICAIAINVLSEYLQFNSNNGAEYLALKGKLDEFRSVQRAACNNLELGGTIQIRREDVLRKSCVDLQDFFESRHSIRQFSDRTVPREIVEKAVRLALRTPSVCNRQSWKAYAFSDSMLLKDVIACQQGNAGFGDQIQTILVVTSNTETFFSIGERNQCWIDGGMFSMSLVYALHSLGLGSICLNWSVEKARDEELHRVASIPESEAIIMMIGIGFLPETLRVAQSTRKQVDEILIWNS